MLKKIIYFSVSILLIVSCSDTKEIIFLKNELPDEQKEYFDLSSDPFSIYIIFEKSMIGCKVSVRDFTSKEILYNDSIVKPSNIDIAEIITPMNVGGLELRIKDKLYFIDGNTYRKHRFLVVKKIKENKYNLTFTNQPANYW
ncbi:hypothetical protein FIA58_020140 [Flavobacterium jejuense]|uniref:Lipoprotein n=1 Tax=Flavobacterium jejuense TaxID=1544455 RepID=A0ABX0IWQ2_9FLAO|nr:hypothetical protein [Flavobacterium jejuense]NHN27996.1 hypothetical protein [Flavobacterium jejuense]